MCRALLASLQTATYQKCRPQSKQRGQKTCEKLQQISSADPNQNRGARKRVKLGHDALGIVLTDSDLHVAVLRHSFDLLQHMNSFPLSQKCYNSIKTEHTKKLEVNAKLPWYHAHLYPFFFHLY